MFRPLVLLPLCVAPSLQAQLLITEINSNGTPADFWELTNFGASAVNLGGYVWDDDSANPTDPAAVTIPAGTTIAAGESIVFPVGTTAASFRSAWNLPGTVQVIAGGPGLGGDDRITLFASAASSTPVVQLGYAAGGFTRSTNSPALGGHAGASAGGSATQSLIWDPNYGTASPRYTFATGANFGSSAAVGGTATGSPGKVGSPASNSPPAFVGPARAFWSQGKSLAFSTFRATASDGDAGQTVTLSVLSKPAWLTLTAAGAGSYKLGGTPGLGEVGDHTFTLRATDNAPVPAVVEKTFTLTVFPVSSPVILNEYNAVGGADSLATGPDTFFGSVPGNGGDWIELAVTGAGNATATVDLRGWKVQVTAEGVTRTLVLSQDPYWASVLPGTLLTFTGENTAGGGLDTRIHRTSLRNSAGYVWTNIWVRDPIFIDQAASDLSAGFQVDNNDTWITLRNAANAVVYGPAGEGIASSDEDANDYPDTLIGLSSTEVLRLQQDPAPAVDPLFGKYNDGEESSFGAPNPWSSGTKLQSFAAYVAANSPPQITSTPVTTARGAYTATITATDPNGAAPTISASGLPSFLTLTPGAAGSATLAGNRALTLADAGVYPIRLQASDGTLATPQAFLLTVQNPSPAVILNEFNAVAADKYLNGGTATSDEDGGALSVDSHFGRVPGNGGRWLELAVTGAGTAGTVDLRGWKVEIGKGNGPAFTPVSTLVLSQDPAWTAVPAGTLLTFIERNTAQGGLDTGIARRNRRATLGDSWTNIWIGDPVYLTYTDAATHGYTVSGGVVSGIGIDSSFTQFRIRDAAGRIVFGPAGEGVAPLSGLSDTEVFELEGHASPAIRPDSLSTEGPGGYDDGASGSTFGWPNQWHTGEGGTLVSQDFTPYAISPFAAYLAGAGLSGASAQPAADPDGDGRDNLGEYAFGGNPALADGPAGALAATATTGTIRLTYDRRADDNSLIYAYQGSPDLVNWTARAATPVSSVAHPTLPGFERVTVEFARSGARDFVRAVATRP